MKKRSLRAALGMALATFAVVALTSTSVGAVPAQVELQPQKTSGCSNFANSGLQTLGTEVYTSVPCGNGPAASCSGTYIFAWPSTGYDLGAYGADVWSNTGPVSLTLPVATTGAGRYSVSAVGYDGFFGRSGEVQPHEQFHIEFLDSGGGVVGLTLLKTVADVEGAVAVAPPAAAVEGTPTFTG